MTFKILLCWFALILSGCQTVKREVTEVKIQTEPVLVGKYMAHESEAEVWRRPDGTRYTKIVLPSGRIYINELDR